MLLMYKFRPLKQGTYAIMNAGATGRLPQGGKRVDSLLSLKLQFS
jgi:hypothetical protein